MKTIRTFVFVVVPVLCAACASESSHTLPAFPAPPTARDIEQPLEKTAEGTYPGYERIVVDGQELYCRQTAVVDSQTGSKVACMTEAEVRSEHQLAQMKAQLLAQERSQARQSQNFETGSRPPTPNIDNQASAMQLQQSVANVPMYSGQH